MARLRDPGATPESEINGNDKQLTEKDVFGSSSDDEEANATTGCPEKAASDGDSAVECYTEDDEDAESDTEDGNVRPSEQQYSGGRPFRNREEDYIINQKI